MANTNNDSIFKPVARERFESKLARPWLNPISLLDLREAVKAEAPTVVLEGKEYTIKYEADHKVWLQYTRGPAPCGRYPIEDIMTPGRIF